MAKKEVEEVKGDAPGSADEATKDGQGPEPMPGRAGLVRLKAPEGFCDADVDGFRVKPDKSGICRVPERVSSVLLGEPHGFRLA